MARIEKLLSEYGESHQNPTNKKVHWICVPAIMVSLIGLIWSIPVPEFMANLSFGPVHVNWALIFIIGAILYYFSLSFSLALGMIIVIIFLLWIGIQIGTILPVPLWASCLILFSLAWIGQFWGHKIEGKKPSFLKDIQFLLIGPLWLLSFIYKKIGIPFTGSSDQ